MGWRLGTPKKVTRHAQGVSLPRLSASTSDVKRHLSLSAATSNRPNPLPRGMPWRYVSSSLLLEDVSSINWDDTADQPARLSSTTARLSRSLLQVPFVQRNVVERKKKPALGAPPPVACDKMPVSLPLSDRSTWTPDSHLRFTGHPGLLADLEAWPTAPIYGMLWQDVRPATPCLVRCVRLRIGRRAIAPL